MLILKMIHDWGMAVVGTVSTPADDLLEKDRLAVIRRRDPDGTDGEEGYVEV
jgi:hypothetical protein